MKLSTFIKVMLITAFLLSQFGVFSLPGKTPAKKSANHTNCLELTCKIEKTKSKVKSLCTVTLMRNDTVVQSLLIEEGKSFTFLLKEEALHSIEIKKEGCVSKTIRINTELPAYTNTKPGYKLSCVIGQLLSLSESQYLDPAVLECPVAIVDFNNEMQAFYVNEAYLNTYKKKVVESLVEHLF